MSDVKSQSSRLLFEAKSGDKTNRSIKSEISELLRLLASKKKQTSNDIWPPCAEFKVPSNDSEYVTVKDILPSEEQNIVL